MCPPTEATREALRGALRELALLVMSAGRSGERIEVYHALPAEALGDEARAVFDALIEALESGEVRAAEPGPRAGASTAG